MSSTRNTLCAISARAVVEASTKASACACQTPPRVQPSVMPRAYAGSTKERRTSSAVSAKLSKMAPMPTCVEPRGSRYEPGTERPSKGSRQRRMGQQIHTNPSENLCARRRARKRGRRTHLCIVDVDSELGETSLANPSAS
eukprot:scaffold27982_cov31-Tisochrysis_lutea.AAC.7